VFLNRQYGKFPNALRQLLDSIHIKKVVHIISSEIGVQVNGAIELGMLARERGVVRVTNCALSEIITALFQCEIDKDPNIRLCDWGKDVLSDDEMNYAAIDA
jgi:ribonuclease D